MSRVYVFYQLKGEKYRLELEDKQVFFVDKNKWNNYVAKYYGRSPAERISPAGGLGIDEDELKQIIGEV